MSRPRGQKIDNSYDVSKPRGKIEMSKPRGQKIANFLEIPKPRGEKTPSVFYEISDSRGKYANSLEMSGLTLKMLTV